MQFVQAISKEYNRRFFDWVARDVLKTNPLQPSGDSPVIVSMLCHRDVRMYLLAIKSFYRALGRGRIVIINDGTLTQKDIDLLNLHVKPSEYVEASDLSSPHCPEYISWKKLFCIARYIKDTYTIQLDSDTLTVGSGLPDVQKHIDTDTSFILGTWKNQQPTSMLEAAIAAQANQSTHVQMLAEKCFDRLPGSDTLKYIRGCSGFDGFAVQSFDLAYLEAFSQQMYSLIGNKWNEWGSEQTTSNVIVANSDRGAVLPYPKYYNYWGEVENGSDFIHFVGSYRYHGGVYRRLARRIIRELSA
ncbi:hypothetical protein [Methylococcus sp. EFPC2]|uniref:hypothetical protein n=1 Tax=Methylococcus sp. EFPC2 TaxID=2812648 RepID=UPI001967BD59|nr:hypothetical protein [Methylococcus sp. EFPC2]QSA95597.1 hypothetical protein JWZ97_10050 [Methylococcus sp. EFPC2]